MRPFPALMCSLLLIRTSITSFSAKARECTCDDLDTIKRRIAYLERAEAAWEEIFAWARGLRQSPPLPSSNEEMDQRYVELMTAPNSSWDSIMSQPVNSNTAAPTKIGGLDDKGEPVVDQNFRNNNCDDIVQAVRLHELTHRTFYLNYSLDNFLSMLMIRSRHERIRAESEVVAHRAEKEFLKGRLKEIEKKCARTATVTTPNGITYTATRCESGPFGPWKLSVSGPMNGQGTVNVVDGGSGSWSATATVSGAGVALTQTGSVQYEDGPQPQLHLTTNMATAMGHTAAPGKSIDLPVTFGGPSCAKP